MDILQILKVVCALATVATGGISLIAPRSIKGFTGLEATGPRGITEIRAVMGGLFIGLGLAPFLLAVPQVYQAAQRMALAGGGAGPGGEDALVVQVRDSVRQNSDLSVSVVRNWLSRPEEGSTAR